jgi:hypothetical protein
MVPGNKTVNSFTMSFNQKELCGAEVKDNAYMVKYTLMKSGEE